MGKNRRRLMISADGGEPITLSYSMYEKANSDSNYGYQEVYVNGTKKIGRQYETGTYRGTVSIEKGDTIKIVAYLKRSSSTCHTYIYLNGTKIVEESEVREASAEYTFKAKKNMNISMTGSCNISTTESYSRANIIETSV